MHALQKLGRSIPDEVAIVGFDDIPAASLSSPPLSTVRQDSRKAGETLVEAAVEAVEYGDALDRSFCPSSWSSASPAARPDRASLFNSKCSASLRMACARERRCAAVEKPRQTFAGLWNISFGFFGIQIGFALQNANMSRIFQSLGSSLDDLPALWVAAPLTGLLVQPIIGHMSDRTWLGRLGRRRPYFLARRDPRRAVAVPDAARAGAAVRGDAAVDARRQPQHFDGAVPRLRRRHAAQGPAHRRLCRADRLHRRRRGRRLADPPGARTVGRVERRAGRRHSGYGPLRLLVRRRRAVPRGAVDRRHDQGIFARGDGGVRRDRRSSGRRVRRSARLPPAAS